MITKKIDVKWYTDNVYNKEVYFEKTVFSQGDSVIPKIKVNITATNGEDLTGIAKFKLPDDTIFAQTVYDFIDGVMTFDIPTEGLNQVGRHNVEITVTRTSDNGTLTMPKTIAYDITGMSSMDYDCYVPEVTVTTVMDLIQALQDANVTAEELFTDIETSTNELNELNEESKVIIDNSTSANITLSNTINDSVEKNNELNSTIDDSVIKNYNLNETINNSIAQNDTLNNTISSANNTNDNLNQSMSDADDKIIEIQEEGNQQLSNVIDQGNTSTAQVVTEGNNQIVRLETANDNYVRDVESDQEDIVIATQQMMDGLNDDVTTGKTNINNQTGRSIELLDNLTTDYLNTIKSVGDDKITEVQNYLPSKEDFGLENVDNTRDMDKPVSTATMEELNKKANSEDVLLKSGVVAMTGSLDLNYNKLKNIGTPVLGTDVVNKSYVDNATSGSGAFWEIVKYHHHIDTGVTSNWFDGITNVSTMVIDPNGSNLTVSEMDDGDRILFLDESPNVNSGIYKVVVNGSVYTLIRTEDANDSSEFIKNKTVSILKGGSHAGSVYAYVSESMPIIGTDQLEFVYKTGTNVGDGTITTEKLSNNSVITSKILDENITLSKLDQSIQNEINTIDSRDTLVLSGAKTYTDSELLNKQDTISVGDGLNITDDVISIVFATNSDIEGGIPW